MKKTLVAILVLACAISSVQAMVVIDGTSGVYETMIANASPMTGSYKFGGNTANYGGLDWFGAKESASTRSLIRFDVSALAGMTVDNMTLRLYQRNTDTTNLGLFLVNEEDSNWEEGTDTGSYSSGWWNRTSWSYCQRAVGDGWSGTWDEQVGSVAALPGVVDGYVDIPLSYSGGIQALFDIWASNGVTDAGRGAFGVPDQDVPAANTGLWILGNGGTFYSSENANGLSPQLIINVPEPATMSLLALGGVAALIRRKK
jgi:hypothetical protein